MGIVQKLSRMPLSVATEGFTRKIAANWLGNLVELHYARRIVRLAWPFLLRSIRDLKLKIPVAGCAQTCVR